MRTSSSLSEQSQEEGQTIKEKSLNLIEVGPRDGFQAEKTPIPTDMKVEIIERLAAAGLRRIQITSFVHPDRVPQMADAEEVCRRVQCRPGVVLSGLVLNRRGIERAHHAGLKHVDVSVSTTESHSRANANMPLSEAIKELTKMLRFARSLDLEVRAGLQCAFGCAYEGEVPISRVIEMAKLILDSDIQIFSLADTTGMATPTRVRFLLDELKDLLEGRPLVLHLHDTRGLGLVNVMEAARQGVSWFDTSFGGLGGCPFIPGATGNIATEDVIYLAESLGMVADIDIRQVAECSLLLEEFLGRRLDGKMHRVLGNRSTNGTNDCRKDYFGTRGARS